MVSSPTQSEPFGRFAGLPTEIRRRIWEFCVPDPRQIVSAIVMIINLDLSNPRGLLPGKKELQKCFNDVSMYNYNEGWEDEPEKNNPSMDFSSRTEIFNMMQSCHESRQVVLETYVLDLDSIVHDEQGSFWKEPDDLIYFQCSEDSQYTDAMLHYLTLLRENTLRGFDSIKHAAFRLDTSFLAVIGWLDQGWNYDSDEEEIMDQHSVLATFPHLETLSVFLDPSNLHQDWRTGKLVLYPPDEEVRIDGTGRNAADTEEAIRERLEPISKFKRSVLPDIDIYVMLRRRSKQRRL